MRKDMRDNGRIVIALGEATGHSHEILTDAGLPPGLETAQYFEEPDGTRYLLLLEPCVLTHQEHGRIALNRDDAARGARGERDAQGCLYGQYRQGDVCLMPTGPGTWRQIRQREYAPDAIRNVAD